MPHLFLKRVSNWRHLAWVKKVFYKENSNVTWGNVSTRKFGLQRNTQSSINSTLYRCVWAVQKISFYVKFLKLLFMSSKIHNPASTTLFIDAFEQYKKSHFTSNFLNYCICQVARQSSLVDSFLADCIIFYYYHPAYSSSKFYDFHVI